MLDLFLFTVYNKDIEDEQEIKKQKMRGDKMLSEERKQIILDLLDKNEIVKLSTLVKVMDTSESSVRRDLAHLEEEGLLERVHGGARKIRHKSEEQSYGEKTSQKMTEKDVIAKKAAELIEENDAIFIDAGTSTYEMIKYLKGKNVFVVTNGLSHIEALASENIECYIIGGKVKLKTKAVIGSDAIKCLNKFAFDKVFLGTNAIDLKFGFTTPDSEEAEFKRVVSNLGKSTYVLADHSKFYNVSNVRFLDIDKAIIITDKSSEIKEFSKVTKVEVAYT